MREASVPVDPPLSQLALDDEQRQYLKRLQDLRDNPECLHFEQARRTASNLKPPVKALGWLPFGVRTDK